MSSYLDANVLVALFVTDAHSSRVDTWIDSDPGDLFVSDFAGIEVAAVVSRRIRAGIMDETEGREALADFDEWTARMTRRIETGAADMALADRLVRDFATKLAGPDALHLALALNRSLELVTFDARLSEAARLRGAKVVEP